jgi:hypothetical protein
MQIPGEESSQDILQIRVEYEKNISHSQLNLIQDVQKTVITYSLSIYFKFDFLILASGHDDD